MRRELDICLSLIGLTVFVSFPFMYKLPQPQLVWGPGGFDVGAEEKKKRTLKGKIGDGRRPPVRARFRASLLFLRIKNKFSVVACLSPGTFQKVFSSPTPLPIPSVGSTVLQTTEHPDAIALALSP
jgi:hypothetical protein